MSTAVDTSTELASGPSEDDTEAYVARNDLLTIAGVAELAGITDKAVRQHRARGTMPDADEVLGRTPVWKRSTIEKWRSTMPIRGWNAATHADRPQTGADTVKLLGAARRIQRDLRVVAESGKLTDDELDTVAAIRYACAQIEERER